MKKLLVNLNEVLKTKHIKFFLILFGVFIVSAGLNDILPFKYIQNIIGSLIIIFCPGIFISYLIPKKYFNENLIEKIVISFGLSILIQPAFIYAFNTYFNFPINIYSIILLNLFYFFLYLTITVVKKDKNEDCILLSKEDIVIIFGYLAICLIYILHSLSYPYLFAGDPYTFKNVTDYIINTGFYPQGFEPLTYLPPYWNYEPLYQLYLALISIFSGLSSFFVYKYISLFLINLSIFPIYLILKKIIPEKINTKHIIIFILSFISIPILFLETEIARPQTILFLFFPIIIYLLILGINKKVCLLIAFVLSLFLSKFHVFYITFLPVVIVATIIINWKNVISNKIKYLKYLAVLIVIIYPYLIIFKTSYRLNWIRSIFQNYPIKLTIQKSFVLLDYIYYLGVFSLILTVFFVFYFYKEKDKNTKLELFILIFFLLELFIFIGIFPSINWGFISDRFFPFLGIVLIITSNYAFYVLLKNNNYLKYKIIFITIALIGSIFVTFHVNSQGSGEWITKNEVASIKKISSKIDNDSIIITQGNGIPLIRQTLGGRYIYILSETEQRTIFYGNSIIDKINLLNNICNFDIRKKEEALSEIKKQYNDLLGILIQKNDTYDIDEIKNKIIIQISKESELMKYSINFKDSNRDSLVEFLIDRKLTILKNEIYLNNLLQRNFNLKPKSLYIIYSFDKNNPAYNGQDWWKEFGNQGANLDFFDKEKEYFNIIGSDNNLKIWEFKECVSENRI